MCVLLPFSWCVCSWESRLLAAYYPVISRLLAPKAHAFAYVCLTCLCLVFCLCLVSWVSGLFVEAVGPVKGGVRLLSPPLIGSTSGRSLQMWAVAVTTATSGIWDPGPGPGPGLEAPEAAGSPTPSQICFSSSLLLPSFHPHLTIDPSPSLILSVFSLPLSSLSSLSFSLLSLL